MEKTYHLDREMHGTIFSDDKRTMVTIPEGSIVSLIDSRPDGLESLEVLWDGQVVRVFAVDLAERTTAGNNAKSKDPEWRGEVPTRQAPMKVRRFTASGREL
jgi:hypothetical protein